MSLRFLGEHRVNFIFYRKEFLFPVEPRLLLKWSLARTSLKNAVRGRGQVLEPLARSAFGLWF